jgi:hypothetical protein
MFPQFTMSYQPSSIPDNYVPYNQVVRVHPNNPEYAVINLRSIARLLAGAERI